MLSNGFGNRDRCNTKAAQAHHVGKFPLHCKLNCFCAVTRRENPVVCSRTSTALKMAEHSNTRLQTGLSAYPLRNVFANPAEAKRVRPFNIGLFHYNLLMCSLCSFCNAYDAEPVAARAPFNHFFKHRPPLERNLRNQDDIRPSR